MALKHHGVLFLMHCVMVQEWLCIFLSCVVVEMKTARGLVASGPVSFGKIYSTLECKSCVVVVSTKNGACVLHLDYDHPDAIEFIKSNKTGVAMGESVVLTLMINLLKNKLSGT